MRKYIVTKKACDKHKIVLKILFLITYILFFPFVILAYIYDFLEIVLNFAEQLRNKIVYGIFKILFKKDCKVERRINNMCECCNYIKDLQKIENRPEDKPGIKHILKVRLITVTKRKGIKRDVGTINWRAFDLNYCPMCGRKLKEGD